MIYLDYNATTPCDLDVLETMLPYFSLKYGNAASKTHPIGWQADEAVKIAAKQISDLIHCEPEEIIFTSGATESCNLAIKGVYEKLNQFGNHIITCVTEHKAVLDTCAHLEKMGANVTYLPVNQNGDISLEQLELAITEKTILIAIMYANNETGMIHPVAKIGAIARARNIYFFCDATQAVGKIRVDVTENKIDLLACSAHKFYGPKGIGILYINRKRPRIQLSEQINGGGHQNGFRSGTLNVPAIVGMGKAANIIKTEQYQAQLIQLQQWRDTLEKSFLKIPNTKINGAATERLPHVLNIAFPDVKAERLIGVLQNDLAFSVGSACTSANQKASHVLEAMNIGAAIQEGSIRLSLGKFLKEEEISIVIQKITKAIEILKMDSDESLKY
ncbi:MAG TPA: cysteine desulfurase family protein [Edaphocola sp.]|nr:cysteine desulfurase family protein [Edaphocola sp.]